MTKQEHAGQAVTGDMIALSGGGRTMVRRQGQVTIRDTGPWAPAVHSLLRHLEDAGFAGAPRVVGSGFDCQGRETLSYIEGEFTQPGPWTVEGVEAIGRLLRDLHSVVARYRPPLDAKWQAWFGRSLGGGSRIISHCDVGPWNIVARNGLPVALIDWEFAGPVDPLVELAQACWLNAKLHDDIVAGIEGLPPLDGRARQLRAIVDGYGLTIRQRRGFVDRIIEVVICDTAEQADEAGIGVDSNHDNTDDRGFNPLWAMAWRARSASWLVHNRRVLQNAL